MGGHFHALAFLPPEQNRSLYGPRSQSGYFQKEESLSAGAGSRTAGRPARSMVTDSVLCFRSSLPLAHFEIVLSNVKVLRAQGTPTWHEVTQLPSFASLQCKNESMHSIGQPVDSTVASRSAVGSSNTFRWPPRREQPVFQADSAVRWHQVITVCRTSIAVALASSRLCPNVSTELHLSLLPSLSVTSPYLPDVTSRQCCRWRTVGRRARTLPRRALLSKCPTFSR